MGHGTVCFEGVVGLQTYVPRLCETRSLIAIYEAGMLRRRGFVHTLSCREGVRATAGLARLRGSPSASLCLGCLDI